MERANGIGGGHLPADDPDGLGRWYADHLGLRATPQRDARGRPGVHLSPTPPTANASDTHEGQASPETAWSVRVTVPDLDAMVAQLRAAGADVAIDTDPTAEGRFAEVRDPEGNLVQLWQPVAAVPTSSEPGYVYAIDATDTSDATGEPEPAPRSRTRRLARWLPLVLVGVLAIGVVSVLQETSGDPDGEEVPQRPAPTSTMLSLPPTSGQGERITVSTVEAPLLGITGDWELFAVSDEALLRIEPARGRITRTPLPTSDTSGPVSLAVGPDRAVLLPFDTVPGYVIPDGDTPHATTGLLRHGGITFPGPEPGQLWLDNLGQNGEERPPVLVTFDGERVARDIPGWNGFWAEMADGNGYLIASGPGGSYLARPDGLRRLTTGDVLAAGPTRLLVHECDARAQCQMAVIDRETGARRVLETDVEPANLSEGRVSPDGSVAAINLQPLGASTSPPVIVDLASGQAHRLDISLTSIPTQQNLVWSPDGRWLFAVSLDRGLVAISTRTWRVHDLGLSNIRQVAIRSG